MKNLSLFKSLMRFVLLTFLSICSGIKRYVWNTDRLFVNRICKQLRSDAHLMYMRALEGAKNGTDTMESYLNVWDAQCQAARSLVTHKFSRLSAPLKAQLHRTMTMKDRFNFEQQVKNEFNSTLEERLKRKAEIEKQINATEVEIKSLQEQKNRVDSRIAGYVLKQFNGIAPIKKEIFDNLRHFMLLLGLGVLGESGITAPALMDKEMLPDGGAWVFSIALSSLLGLLARFAGHRIALSQWRPVWAAMGTSALIFGAIFYVRLGSEFEVVLGILNVGFFALLLLLSWRYYYYRPYWTHIEESARLRQEIDRKRKEISTSKSDANNVETIGQSKAITAVQNKSDELSAQELTLESKIMRLDKRRQRSLELLDPIQQAGIAAIKKAWVEGQGTAAAFILALFLFGTGCTMQPHTTDVLIAVDQTRHEATQVYQEAEEVAAYIIRNIVRDDRTYFSRYRVRVLFSTIGEYSIQTLSPLVLEMDDPFWAKKTKEQERRLDIFRSDLVEKLGSYFSTGDGLDVTNLNRTIAFHLNYLDEHSAAQQRYYFHFGDLLLNDGRMNWHVRPPTAAAYNEMAEYLNDDAPLPHDLRGIDMYFVFMPNDTPGEVDQPHHAAKSFWKQYLTARNGTPVFLPNLL